jgi:CHAD domain-containing protein
LFAEMPLRFAQASDAERGYDLMVGRGRASPRPERARQLVLARDATCRDALYEFTRLAAQQIEANRRVTLETEDPEGPHRLRIALRRLRSAIRAFRPLIDTASTRALDRHAGAVARSVGELRDADVFFEGIYAPAAGAMKGHAGLQPLKEALAKHRARTREEARAALQGNHWWALELHLSLWPRTLEGCAALDRRAEDFAAEALEACWRKAARKGTHVARLTDEERHAMRKRLKRLRYAVEFLCSLYEPGRVQPFLKRLKQLQDVLGYVNDVATARRLEGVADEFAGDNRECQRAVGYMLGWHGARATACWDTAQERWGKLRHTGRFWR